MAVLQDDKIWWTHLRKLAGICDELVELSSNGAYVLLVSHFESLQARFESELTARAIPFQRIALSEVQLPCSGKHGGPAVSLSLASSLSQPTSSASESVSAPLHVIIAEHHPMRSHDERLSETLLKIGCAQSVTFHVSLDEPLMIHFGVDSIRQLLRQLGADEETCLSNPLITKAIRRAQDKIGSHVQRDLPLQSSSDWFRYNFRA